VPQATAPATGAPGGTLAVSWTVQNQGSAATTTGWQDSVYLSPTPQITSSSELLQGIAAPTSAAQPLATGQSYTQNQTITLPFPRPLLARVDTRASQYLVFRANSNGQQAETDLSNNTFAVSFSLQLPDITVNNVQAPATAVTGGPLSVTWTDRNIGTADAWA